MHRVVSTKKRAMQLLRIISWPLWCGCGNRTPIPREGRGAQECIIAVLNSRRPSPSIGWHVHGAPTHALTRPATDMYAFCSGHGHSPLPVPLVRPPVLLRHGVGIWTCCSGCGRRSRHVLGMNIAVCQQPLRGICMFSSGYGLETSRVLGVGTLVERQQWGAICKHCSSYEKELVHGMPQQQPMLLTLDTSIFSSGHAACQTPCHGTAAPTRMLLPTNSAKCSTGCGRRSLLAPPRRLIGAASVPPRREEASCKRCRCSEHRTHQDDIYPCDESTLYLCRS